MSKEYCKADNNLQCIAFLEQYFGWEYHPSSGVQMLQNKKPEEGWYGQPKYCSKRAIHVVMSFAVVSGLFFSFLFLIF